jgi:hypothetical protein
MADLAVGHWRGGRTQPRNIRWSGDASARLGPSQQPRTIRWYGDHDVPSARLGPSRFTHYENRPWGAAGRVVFVGLLALAMLIGWQRSDSGYAIDDPAIRYMLGVGGAVCMLLLLLYPLRKRAGLLVGSVAFWFRLHMALGLIGPALIMYHANFSLGPRDSNAAMIALLAVAASGLFGRYLYGKTHLGLYGRKTAMRELLADAGALESALGNGLPGSDHIAAQMHGYAKRAIAKRKGVLALVWTLPMIGLRGRFLRRQLQRDARRLVKAEGKRRGWTRRMRRHQIAAIAKLLKLHGAVVRKAAGFELYDRLFRIWHAVHVPMFVLLLVAVGLHVIAAHAH